jgi:hypothetical protein
MRGNEGASGSSKFPSAATIAERLSLALGKEGAQAETLNETAESKEYQLGL